jgi:pyridoxamine 5'-phosphate oxidase
MPSPEPFGHFGSWFAEATAREARWANVMTVATATADGRPSSRAVVLTGWDERGLVFCTDERSRKVTELAANPWVAAVFLWPACERQVRVEGQVAPVSDEEADRSFTTTPRPARLAVWATRQGKVIADRSVLERGWKEADDRHREDVPRPPWWRGYRLQPHAFEFWEASPDALHHRRRYDRLDDRTWRVERLAP